MSGPREQSHPPVEMEEILYLEKVGFYVYSDLGKKRASCRACSSEIPAKERRLVVAFNHGGKAAKGGSWTRSKLFFHAECWEKMSARSTGGVFCRVCKVPTERVALGRINLWREGKGENILICEPCAKLYTICAFCHWAYPNQTVSRVIRVGDATQTHPSTHRITVGDYLCSLCDASFGFVTETSINIIQLEQSVVRQELNRGALSLDN